MNLVLTQSSETLTLSYGRVDAIMDVACRNEATSEIANEPYSLHATATNLSALGLEAVWGACDQGYACRRVIAGAYSTV